MTQFTFTPSAFTFRYDGANFDAAKAFIDRHAPGLKVQKGKENDLLITHMLGQVHTTSVGPGLHIVVFMGSITALDDNELNRAMGRV